MARDLTGGVDPAREYLYAERPAGEGVRDAVNVWIEEESGEFGMRVGVEAVSDNWDAHYVWLDIAFPYGRVLSQRGDMASHSPIGPSGQPTILGAGPIRFECVKPFETWRVSYDGTASQMTATDLINDIEPTDPAAETPVSFDIEMTMAAPPWVPGSLIKEAGEILGGGDQGDFMSPRYEQLFRARGEMRISGESYDFKANGLRIRRQGFRKFEGFWGHCWQSAVFPSGKAFGFNVYPPRADGKPSYSEGFIYTADGKRTPARPVEIPWLRKLTTHGDDVSFVLEAVDGSQRIAVKGETFINTRSRGASALPAEFPIVQQAHVRYVWDGEETTGMIERSSLRDVMEL